MRQANIRDAVALIELASELEQGMSEGEYWDELKASNRIKKLRSQQLYNKGVSFGSISAYGANAAIIHYRPTPKTNTKIGYDSLYLLDSGKGD